jgi:hypothetical protein
MAKSEEFLRDLCESFAIFAVKALNCQLLNRQGRKELPAKSAEDEGVRG